MNKTALSALAVAAVLVIAGQALALTLTNRDVSDLRLQIRESGSDASQTITIQPQQTLDGICQSGCTIALENGTLEDFEGHEVVEVRDGLFVIAE